MASDTAARQAEQRWSAPVIAAGYTVLPSIVLKRQKKLGLDGLDLNIVMHLLSYWWKGSDPPFPSKRSLSEAIGVDPSTIRRRIQKLETTLMCDIEHNTPQLFGRIVPNSNTCQHPKVTLNPNALNIYNNKLSLYNNY